MTRADGIPIDAGVYDGNMDDDLESRGPADAGVARIFRHEKNDRLRVCRIDGCRGGSCKP